ncbi:hypothetical protein KYY02_19550 [Streptomyces pimonensis]|uniref:Uncharacterized protein n=1 Tax=Streptomyces pimonensis TaxID=2860288 RepID=A0ABV4J3L6_9ACTN
MSEPITAAEAPLPAPMPRYFLHSEGSLQSVHNLRDPGPYLAAGFEEMDEATYRAALDGGMSGSVADTTVEREV